MGPIVRTDFVLFGDVEVSSEEELEQYRIGAVAGSLETELFEDVITGEDPEEMISLLESGQIDLWATGELAGRHQMKLSNVSYEKVWTIREQELYYAFSRDVPVLMVEAFGESFDTVYNRKDEQGVSKYERIVYRHMGVSSAKQSYSDARVMELVNDTADDLAEDTPGTLESMNLGQAPYVKEDGLYCFVYDTNTTIVGHATNIKIVGVNLKGKTDVTGKAYRDEILAGALADGSGWEEYVYLNPSMANLYHKKTFYRLAEGSDGKEYVVCAGNYRV